MDRRGQGQSHPFQNARPGESGRGKKNSASLLESLEAIVARCSGACSKAAARSRLREHLLCVLLCLGRRTLTGVITTSGKQYRDWSADYRLYSKGRVDPDICFQAIREIVEGRLAPGAPLVVAIDDTIARKSGARIDGVSYRKDPLGPKFQVNLVLAQRFIQLSAAMPGEDGSARLVPVDFKHAPSPRKPGAKADPSQVAEYKERRKQLNLNALANERIASLRAETRPGRKLVLTVDGSYTNATVIRSLPENTTLIGRVRRDAVLCSLPGVGKAKGRRRVYGQDMPTPEELRQDEGVPWREVEAFAAGRRHRFRIKVVKSLLWRKCGGDRLLQLVVVAPLRYRLRKGSRALYRKPAYLICTDNELDERELLQFYLWRWQIETNFRDEKTLLGLGQAQVRTKQSNESLPAVQVAAYSMLWLAALESDLGEGPLSPFEPAKWRRDLKGRTAPTTSQLLQRLRYEAWAGSLRPSSFSHFAPKGSKDAKPEKSAPNLASSLFQVA